MATSIAVFKGKEIRKTIHKDQWWFSVSDVVEALTDSVDQKQYIKKMRQRDPELNSYWGTICTPPRKGGEVAGKARKDLEQKTGRRVVSRENYLTTPQEMKKIERK